MYIYNICRQNSLIVQSAMSRLQEQFFSNLYENQYTELFVVKPFVLIVAYS